MKKRVQMKSIRIEKSIQIEKSIRMESIRMKSI